jgi:hypothetical protein
MNRKPMVFAVAVMMLAMVSFLALTPAWYVLQAQANSYRYHEFLSACAEAAAGQPGFREGYVYDPEGRLAAHVAARDLGGKIALSAPTWNVYHYRAVEAVDCGKTDGLYLAGKVGLAVSEK